MNIFSFGKFMLEILKYYGYNGMIGYSIGKNLIKIEYPSFPDYPFFNTIFQAL